MTKPVEYVKCRQIKRHLLENRNGTIDFQWDLSAPFYFNPNGVLVHRVKCLHTHNGSVNPGRLIADFWCGSFHSSGCDDFLLFDIPAGRMLCERCEVSAIAAGEKPADEILGRHVHIGRMVPQQVCCVKKSDD